MKTPIILLSFALLSLSALAADVTGTWKADFDTPRGLQKYTFTLKQDGTNVTGKISAERDGEKREADVKEGKVDGDTVTFIEMLAVQDNTLRVEFPGRGGADAIKFTRRVGDFGSTEAVAKMDPPSAPARGGG